MTSQRRACQAGRVTQRDREQAVVFRGTALDRVAFAQIQKVIGASPELTRAEISRLVCAKFGWRQPDGRYAESACRLFLGRMERRGLVRLPEPRRRGNYRRGVGGHAGLELVGWPPDFDAARLDGPLVVRPLEAEERLEWELHVDRYHYLGACPLVGESLRYVALCEGVPVALLGWAGAVLHNGPREQYVGWSEEEKARGLHLVANNVRFVVLPWARRPHVASRVLGANLRRLSADWRERYGHPIVLAETFVDRSRFRGTCYRASNWVELGETRGFGRSGLRYTAHGRPKTVLVYPLHRKAKTLLRDASSACVKAEVRVQVFEAEALPLYGEGSLFELVESVHDPRKKRGIRHSLASVLAVALCATLAGARSLEAIAQWGKEQSGEMLERLGCRRRKAPSEPTFRRMLKKVGAERFDQLSGDWAMRAKVRRTVATASSGATADAAEIHDCPGLTNADDSSLRPAGSEDAPPPLAGKGLALDGKTLCGSSDGETKRVHLVSAVLHEDGAVIAQHRVPDKTNEIKSVEPVLSSLDIRGAMVTGDAMFTQKEIARHVVEDKRADYLLGVKENQPTLLADIETLRMEGFPPCALHY